MNLNELISEETIILDIKQKTKEAVINELIETLSAANKINNSRKFKRAILAREKLSSTGIGDGVAIPHAKSKAVNFPSIAIGISKSGIDYNSMDQKPVSLFFMIAAPENANDLHLEALSQLARHLIHKEFRDNLLKANSKSEVLELINQG